MSKMPTDRNSDWQQIFDRFGSLDGGRHKPATETVKPGSVRRVDRSNELPTGSLLPQTSQDRRARK